MCNIQSLFNLQKMSVTRINERKVYLFDDVGDDWIKLFDPGTFWSFLNPFTTNGCQ